MKLYVDDLRRAPEGWVCVRTVTDAIRMLACQNVDEISLDHDITIATPKDSRIYVRLASNETFEPVARYIALMPERPAVRFHTANPVGEKKMREILGL